MTPITMKNKMLQEGLEPPTLGLLDPCSTKLSYQSRKLTLTEVFERYHRACIQSTFE